MSMIQILRNKDNLDVLAKHVEAIVPEINDDDESSVYMKVGRSDLYSVVIYLFYEGEGSDPAASIAYVVDQWEPNFHIHTRKTSILAAVADNIHRVIEKVKAKEEEVTGKLGPNTDKVLSFIQLRSNFHSSLREFARETRRNPHKSKTVSFGLHGKSGNVTVSYDAGSRDELRFEATAPDPLLGVHTLAKLRQTGSEVVTFVPEFSNVTGSRGIRALSEATDFFADLNESLSRLFNVNVKAEEEEE